MRGATTVHQSRRRQRFLFQSTRPMRGATQFRHFERYAQDYFNPRAPCGARLCLASGIRSMWRISIHAPHAGRDPKHPQSTRGAYLFQSTRPMRGATRCLASHPWPSRFQSTRPMRGATHELKELETEITFQSTRPMRGATEAINGLVLIGKISIHAPHAGRDPMSNVPRLPSGNFNPRAPCGARPVSSCITDGDALFQSTRPMRGATLPHREERFSYPFQSTRPMRGATCIDSFWHFHIIFQSTRPMRGATRFPRDCPPRRKDFNPRAPCGARLSDIKDLFASTIISIHAPHAGRD
mgnify:CR=1 FL=1